MSPTAVTETTVTETAVTETAVITTALTETSVIDTAVIETARTETAVIETIDTPDGPFTILADGAERVLASGWTDEPAAVVARLHPRHRPARILTGTTDAAAAARAYYAGEITAIDAVQVVQSGTPLQRRGWQALREIAPGGPLTYTGFASALGHPAAVRAAAGICARNAPALFVPCHRVLRADGSLGGFAWGTEVKRSLLAREAAGDRS